MVANRSKGIGCPFCAGFLPSATHNLLSKHPKLASEWHPTMNGSLKPSAVVPGSHTSVWWICSWGHEWQAAIKQRVVGTGCPYCAGRRVSPDNCMAAHYEDLAKEWHPARNGDLLPSQVTPGSGRIVWWRCSKGHEWRAAIAHRVKGSRCPFCAGRISTLQTCLAATHPDLAKQWHPTKNGDLKPTNVTRGSARKVWWRCAQRHEWQATVGHRVSGRGCPYCAGKRFTEENSLAVCHPKLAMEWHPTKNQGLVPSAFSCGSSKSVWWLCCRGHQWKARISHRSNGSECPICARIPREYSTAD